MQRAKSPSSSFLYLFRATPEAYGKFLVRDELETQLPAYTTATAKPDPSRFCDLRHSSRQCPILNPLSGVGIETESSWILVVFATAEPQQGLLNLLLNAPPIASDF